MKKELYGFVSRTRTGGYIIFSERPKHFINGGRFGNGEWTEGNGQVFVERELQDMLKETPPFGEMIVGNYPKKVRITIDVEEVEETE